MRSDYHKLMHEKTRESKNRTRFHDVRRCSRAAVNDDEYAGRESMKSRFKITGDYRQTSWNSSGIHRWLRSRLGKVWNDSYSELCSTIDRRTPTAREVFDYIDRYVSTNAFMKDGEVWVRSEGWRSGVHLAENAGFDFIVHPTTGILFDPHKNKNSRRVAARERQRKAEAEYKSRFVVHEDVALHLIDGAWFVFDLLPLKPSKVIYKKPYGQRFFYLGWDRNFDHANIDPSHPQVRAWENLTENEKARFGTATYSNEVRDEFLDRNVFVVEGQKYNFGPWSNPFQYYVRSMIGCRYHANKRSAPSSLIKTLGLEVPETTSTRSNRDLKKYA